MGTFYPVRTKHKLIQNPVCVEETSRCSSELGGRAFFFFFLQILFLIKIEIHQWWDGRWLKD